jgi:hypothetical protein
VNGAAWPEADILFRSDPHWLGSDDAYSIPLSAGRTLWMFGDTFIGDGTDADRSRATFVRNTIAIQQGDDPASSAIRFIWGEADGAPGSFFDIETPNWLWPLDGVRVDGKLLLFFMLVRPSEVGRTGGIHDWRVQGPLGFFDVFGWACVRVENPDDEPESWDWSYVAPMEASPIVLGAAAMLDGEYVYLYGWDQPKHLYVARLRVADAAAAAFGSLEWWTGTAWGGAPQWVVDRGGTEFTVHRDGDRFLMTAVVGVNPASLAVRVASAPQGPWSEPQVAFTPEENDRVDAFVYAGKAHPQLVGADLVCTYASNGPVDITLKDDSLYYPRFVRVST